MEDLPPSLWQFDYDMSLAIFFMNADGTLYGRYGSRNGGLKEAERLLSLSSLEKAMARALEIHRGYPANRDSLKDKQSSPLVWKDYPEAWKVLETTSASIRRGGASLCLHCHTYWESIQKKVQKKDEPLPAEFLWGYPLPENIGLRIDTADGTRVKSTISGSPAEGAGIQPGDDIEEVSGQPILSLADIQWALWRAPTSTTLQLGVRRGDAKMTVAIPLSGRWKKTDISWRESSKKMLPALQGALRGRFGFPSLHELEPEEREKLGIPDGALALRLRTSGIARTGLQGGDVVVALDGSSERMSDLQFLMALWEGYPPGAEVPVTILRGGERLTVTLIRN